MSPKRIEVEQILVSLSDTSHYLIGKDYKVSVADFCTELKKKDGRDYEPESLGVMQA